MRCQHLGKQTGLADTPFGREPQYECQHSRYSRATLAICCLCKDYLSEEAVRSDVAPGDCPHPTGMIVDRYGRDAGVADLFRGASCFLVLGGPSLKAMPLHLLSRRGVLIMSVNNCPAALPQGIRPHIWMHTDPAGKFHDSIWRDPGILKIVPVREWDCARAKKRRGMFHRDPQSGEIVHTPNVRGKDMPGVLGFERNTRFQPHQWLWEPSINRGNDEKSAKGDDKKGLPTNNWPKCINTMFAALRLPFYLGNKRLYLLGADFHMEDDAVYAFDQGKSKGGVRGNNNSYACMCSMLDGLKPSFDAVGYEVINCSPGSNLWTFPSMAFEDAIEEATGSFEQELQTEGWYDKDD